MEIIKTHDKKYPIIATLSDGTKIKVPKQSKFSNTWLRSHGCSLMAMYEALQFCGKHIYPLHLYQWFKEHDKSDIKAKVTVKGVAKGINYYKAGHAKYDSTPTYEEIEKALKEGKAVILEQKNPIHTIFLIQDAGINYIINYGAVKKVNIKRIAKTATSNKTYKGMVIVER
jgi:hypothetical protein